MSVSWEKVEPPLRFGSRSYALPSQGRFPGHARVRRSRNGPDYVGCDPVFVVQSASLFERRATFELGLMMINRCCSVGFSPVRQVIRMLGHGRAECYCYDGVTRLGHIRGKMRKKVWVSAGDIVLVGKRDYQDDKVCCLVRLKSYTVMIESTGVHCMTKVRSAVAGLAYALSSGHG